jgi:hypothetical protein
MERPGTFPDPQRELIDEYCSEARQLLEHARDRDEAMQIAERVCARFAGHCRSSLVLAATRAYVERVLCLPLRHSRIGGHVS